MTKRRVPSSLRKDEITFHDISINLPPIKSLLSFLSLLPRAKFNIRKALGDSTSSPIDAEVNGFQLAVIAEDLVEMFIGHVSREFVDVECAHGTWCPLPLR